MTTEEIIRLVLMGFEEGYKSAMMIIKNVAEDKTHDDKLREMMEARIKELTLKKN